MADYLLTNVVQKNLINDKNNVNKLCPCMNSKDFQFLFELQSSDPKQNKL